VNPQVRHAQRACEAAKARAVASYGETKAECAAVKPLCNASRAISTATSKLFSQRLKDALYHD
jgi:hypothetical protein